MLYDTHGQDDININEEIAKKLQAEGHSIDMTQFSPTTDSASEGSGASSPQPPSTRATNEPSTSAAREQEVEELQAVTKRLTMTDEASQMTSNIVVNGGAGDASSTRGASVKPSVQTMLVNREGLKSSLSAGPPPSTPATLADSTVLCSSSPGVTPPRMGVSVPNSDYQNLAYDTWPLPAYAPLPEVGQFFDVFVQSITNPSSFVVSRQGLFFVVVAHVLVYSLLSAISFPFSRCHHAVCSQTLVLAFSQTSFE